MEDNKNLENERYEKGESDIFEKRAHYDPIKKSDSDIERENYLSMRSKKDEGKITSPFLTRVENFFYHYKWHTVAALAVVLILTFILLQNCSKTVYDAHILYAGGKNLRTISEDESEMAYYPLYSASGRFVSDFDGDGNRNVSLVDIYLPSDDEIKKEENSGGSVNYTLLKENDELLRQNMLFGDYYICLLSESLFIEWTKNESSNPFVKITELLPENATIAKNDDDEGYRLASEYGVYLSSTPTADNPGFSQLPKDTVIAFRKYTSSSSYGKGEKAKSYYNHCENIVRLMLEDKAYS